MKRLIIISLIFISFLNAWDLDKKVKKDESGWIGAHYDIPKYSFVGLVGMAAYEGSESRLGKTSWQALDAAVMSQLITEVLKKSTKRNRPRESDGPTEWNEDGNSFPSGHVSGMTAMVAPFVFEYEKDYPLVQLLWALPLHQMVGRVKAQAHWQSDVIAGFLVGYGSAYWAHSRKTPMLLYFDSDKVIVGIKHRF